MPWFFVHGDIRHLEIQGTWNNTTQSVHGDIRHLEIKINYPLQAWNVHGDIRHLEILACHRQKY